MTRRSKVVATFDGPAARMGWYALRKVARFSRVAKTHGCRWLGVPRFRAFEDISRTARLLVPTATTHRKDDHHRGAFWRDGGENNWWRSEFWTAANRNPCEKGFTLDDRFLDARTQWTFFGS